MKYRIIIQPRVHAAIDAQYAHIAESNRTAAARWFNRVYSAIYGLESFPERCPVVPEISIAGRTIRQLLFGRSRVHRILFVVEADAVRVVCIRHASRSDPSDQELSNE